MRRDVNQRTLLLKQCLPAWQFSRLEIHGPVTALSQSSKDGDEAKPVPVDSVGIARAENEREAEDLCLYNYNKYSTTSSLGRWNLSSSITFNAGWYPLATLILSFPSLKDLVFIIDEVFPRCLLAAVKKHSYTPRLHLETFRFHCMIDLTKSSVMNAHELAVATSKNLHSINFSGAYPGMNHHNTILNVIAGTAPNLQSVTYFRSSGSRIRNSCKNPRANKQNN